VWFAEDLLGTPSRFPIPSVRDDLRKAGDPAEDPVEPMPEEVERVLSPDRMTDLLREALAGEGDVRVDVIGSRIHVRTPQADPEGARQLLRSLAAPLARPLVVEFRMGRIDGRAGPLPREPEELAARLGAVASVPVTLSDQFLLAGGLEQSAVIDQDVEIAQQAQIADPIVAPLFDGYVISGVASPAGPDRIELMVDLQHQQVLPWPNAGFPSRAENVGPVDLPQVDGTSGRHKLLLEAGRWSVLAATNPGESAALVIVARARW
jgi:hypothetical protein